MPDYINNSLSRLTLNSSSSSQNFQKPSAANNNSSGLNIFSPVSSGSFGGTSTGGYSNMYDYGNLINKYVGIINTPVNFGFYSSCGLGGPMTGSTGNTSNNSLIDLVLNLLTGSQDNSQAASPAKIKPGNEIANQNNAPADNFIGNVDISGDNYGVFLRGADKSNGWEWDFDPNKLKGLSSTDIKNLIKNAEVLLHLREVNSDGSLGDPSSAFNVNYNEAIKRGIISG